MGAASTQSGRGGQILERDRDDVLDAAKPLPAGEDALIADLSEDEIASSSRPSSVYEVWLPRPDGPAQPRAPRS